jgi:hypothetical protein
MNQFLIHMAANNTAAAAAAKKDIPANFEDFEAADGLVLEVMIERSGALLTCKLAMIKSRTSSLGTNFSDHTKMRLTSEQDLDDLIEATDKEYLIQVNRWLVRTIHGAIYPDGHTATTATNGGVMETTWHCNVCKDRLQIRRICRRPQRHVHRRDFRTPVLGNYHGCKRKKLSSKLTTPWRSWLKTSRRISTTSQLS